MEALVTGSIARGATLTIVMRICSILLTYKHFRNYGILLSKEF